MRLEAIKDILQCQVLTGDLDLSIEVDTVLASDGMSEILRISTLREPGRSRVSPIFNPLGQPILPMCGLLCISAESGRMIRRSRLRAIKILW